MHRDLAWTYHYPPPRRCPDRRPGGVYKRGVDHVDGVAPAAAALIVAQQLGLLPVGGRQHGQPHLGRSRRSSRRVISRTPSGCAQSRFQRPGLLSRAFTGAGHDCTTWTASRRRRPASRPESELGGHGANTSPSTVRIADTRSFETSVSIAGAEDWRLCLALSMPQLATLAPRLIRKAAPTSAITAVPAPLTSLTENIF